MINLLSKKSYLKKKNFFNSTLLAVDEKLQCNKFSRSGFKIGSNSCRRYENAQSMSLPLFHMNKRIIHQIGKLILTKASGRMVHDAR